MSSSLQTISSAAPVHPSLQEFDTQFESLSRNPPSVSTLEEFEHYQDLHSRLKRILTSTHFALQHEIAKLGALSQKNSSISVIEGSTDSPLGSMTKEELEVQAKDHLKDTIACTQRMVMLKMFHYKMKVKAYPPFHQKQILQTILTQFKHPDLEIAPESVKSLSVKLSKFNRMKQNFTTEQALTLAFLLCPSLGNLTLKSSGYGQSETLHCPKLMAQMLGQELLTELHLINVKVAPELQPTLFKIIELKLNSFTWLNGRTLAPHDRELFLKSITNSRELQRLTLKLPDGFPPEDLNLIAEFVKTTEKLSLLEISGVKANVDNGKQFAEALKNNKSITRFSLTFKDKKFGALAQMLFSDVLWRNSTLTSLTLKNKKRFQPATYPALLASLLRHNTLTQLELISESGFGAKHKDWKKAVTNAERTLKDCSSLIDLRLPVSLTRNSKEHLARNKHNLEKRLETLLHILLQIDLYPTPNIDLDSSSDSESSSASSSDSSASSTEDELYLNPPQPMTPRLVVERKHFGRRHSSSSQTSSSSSDLESTSQSKEEKANTVMSDVLNDFLHLFESLKPSANQPQDHLDSSDDSIPTSESSTDDEREPPALRTGRMREISSSSSDSSSSESSSSDSD
ncbi:MAG: hypothetical protein K2P51_01885 [Rhabdochlamydiaceae bacterium]|nr:hypothetical protein [Rhabdochlamydiaceae bacterium]